MSNDCDQPTMSVGDSDIVERILAGEIDLYHVLVRRYNRRLYHVAWSILRNEHEAEDVVQETHVRAYEKLSQFGGRSQFATWLTRIAIHEALSRKTRLSKEAEVAVGAALLRHRSQTFDRPEQSCLNAEAQGALEDAISTLPEEQRTVFIMHFVDEISILDIAEYLQVRRSVVKMRLFRARRLLRRSLYELARVTSPSAFLFLGERCDRLSDCVKVRIGDIAHSGHRDVG